MPNRRGRQGRKNVRFRHGFANDDRQIVKAINLRRVGEGEDVYERDICLRVVDEGAASIGVFFLAGSRRIERWDNGGVGEGLEWPTGRPGITDLASLAASSSFMPYVCLSLPFCPLSAYVGKMDGR